MGQRRGAFFGNVFPQKNVTLGYRSTGQIYFCQYEAEGFYELQKISTKGWNQGSCGGKARTAVFYAKACASQLYDSGICVVFVGMVCKHQYAVTY